jgi:hypothetical protein
MLEALLFGLGETTRSPAILFIAALGQGIAAGLDGPKPNNQH